MIAPETIQKWVTWFFESRWTGHLGLGFLVAGTVWLMGSADGWWGVPPDKVLVALGLGVAAVTYSCDHALTRWLDG